MKQSIQFCIAAGILTALCATSWARTDNNGLVLEAEPTTTELLERIPLVVRLTIRNTGADSVDIRFRQRNAGAIERYSALALATGEQAYRLTYVGGPQANMPILPADHSLRPGSSIVVERVIPLIVRTVPAPGSKEHDDWHRYQPIAAGVYTGHFEVDVGHGRRLVSDEFALTIVEAQGVDRKARDEIAFRHVDFFVGRARAPDESYYYGGKWWKKVDVSRFGEIQKILDDYPDSTYAEWIRFWKVYHHGSSDEALKYARTHREFPLSDNLMLRAINRVANDDEQHERARELLDEFQRLFPKGDTRPAALTLQEQLAKKKKRD